MDLEAQENNKELTQKEVNMLLTQHIVHVHTLMKILFVDYYDFPEKEYNRIFKEIDKIVTEKYPQELDDILNKIKCW